MSGARVFSWYHSQADLIWSYGPFKVYTVSRKKLIFYLKWTQIWLKGPNLVWIRVSKAVERLSMRNCNSPWIIEEDRDPRVSGSYQNYQNGAVNN
jgi:hypothetical protein